MSDEQEHSELNPAEKIEPKKEDSSLNQDLAIITQMNQEFATSLDSKFR